MAKRKDYLRLFVQYASKNNLWFAVFGDGCIDAVTDCELGIDFEPICGLKLGSKRAYEWLVETHQSGKDK